MMDKVATRYYHLKDKMDEAYIRYSRNPSPRLNEEYKHALTEFQDFCVWVAASLVGDESYSSAEQNLDNTYII